MLIINVQGDRKVFMGGNEMALTAFPLWNELPPKIYAVFTTCNSPQGLLSFFSFINTICPLCPSEMLLLVIFHAVISHLSLWLEGLGKKKWLHMSAQV